MQTDEPQILTREEMRAMAREMSAKLGYDCGAAAALERWKRYAPEEGAELAREGAGDGHRLFQESMAKWAPQLKAALELHDVGKSGSGFQSRLVDEEKSRRQKINVI